MQSIIWCHYVKKLQASHPVATSGRPQYDSRAAYGARFISYSSFSYMSVFKLNVPFPSAGENLGFVNPDFTRAYVAHLIRSKEMLGSIICSQHNLGFILRLVSGARQAILDGRFAEYRADFERDYYHS